METGETEIDGLMFDESVGYNGSELVAVYELDSAATRRRKRSTSAVVAELEITAKDGAVTGGAIDGVFGDGS